MRRYFLYPSDQALFKTQGVRIRTFSHKRLPNKSTLQLARLLFQKSGDKIPWLGRLGWWLEAAILKLFWKWVSASSVERASARGYRLFSWLGPRLNKNRHVMGNLRIAFPGMSQAEYEALAEAVWGNIGAVLAEYPFLKIMVETGPHSHTAIEMHGASKAIVESKESAVYVTPHLGNWEIAAATVAKLEIPITTIYSPQSNPDVDRMILTVRESLGLKFVPKENAVRQLLKALRQGRSVGMLPDQRIDEGDLIPYFGIDAPTASTPAWLAIKMKRPLIPVEVERSGPARFRVVFHEPIDTGADIKDDRQRVLETTRQVNACFEQWIRKHPEHWHCAKRRWPKQAYQDQLT